MDDDRFLSTDEVVEYLKIPKSTIYKLTERDDLPSCKIGKQLRFRKSSLDKWLAEKEKKNIKPANVQSPNILLIDDDNLILKSVTRLLTSHGHTVDAAESGEEALAKVQAKKYDLVIADVRMPGIDGIETIKRIREINFKLNQPNIPEIIITGFMDIEAQQKAQEVGISDYIYKPFVTTDFMETIARKFGPN
jgi:excisionase family DNA binding protein